MVADKPAGMPVHPTSPEGTGTLVNALLSSNRWLAEMETSLAPGVIHVLEPLDRGLVLVAKSDETAQELRDLYQSGRITFSYRVRVNAGKEPHAEAPVTVFDHQTYDDIVVYDIDSAIGDTATLRSEWLPDGADASFVAYRIHVPMTHQTLDIGLGERVWLPQVDLYTAPP